MDRTMQQLVNPKVQIRVEIHQDQMNSFVGYFNPLTGLCGSLITAHKAVSESDVLPHDFAQIECHA